jgi:hypothetical protein
MSRAKRDELSPLSVEERGWLERIGRPQNEPVSHVLRAK